MISIMIPTMNRSDFIIRLLDYYDCVRFPYMILIADSSSGEHLLRVKEYVRKYEGRLKIQHLQCPSMSVYECLKLMVDALVTPYAVYVADDDFLLHSGLTQCLNFLEAHQDYSCAQGEGILFDLDRSGPYGQFQAISQYPLGSLEQSGANNRLVAFLENYFSNVFPVVRTEHWRCIADHIMSMPDGHVAGEMWPGALLAVRGKVKKLPCPYLVRQNHDRRNISLDVFEWLINPAFGKSYSVMASILIKEIVQNDGVSQEQAKKLVYKGLVSYLVKTLSNYYGNRYVYDSSMKKKIKGILEKYPKISNWMKKWMGKRAEISVSTFFEEKSPWSEEFRKIYDQVSLKEEVIHGKH